MIPGHSNRPAFWPNAKTIKVGPPLSFDEAKAHVFERWAGVLDRLSIEELRDQIREVIRAARGRKRKADQDTKRRLNAALLCLEDALARLEDE